MKLNDHWVFVKEGLTPILGLGLKMSKYSKEEISAIGEDNTQVINNLTKALGET